MRSPRPPTRPRPRATSATRPTTVGSGTGTYVVLTTVGGLDKALEIGETLVRERLAACVNLVPGVRSIYRWKGEVCRDEEVLLVVKTAGSAWPLLERRLRALHPYQCPEIIALPIEAGAEPYLRWIAESVTDRYEAVPEE